MVDIRKDNVIPWVIAAAAAVVSLLVVINLPSMRFLGLDWRIALIAGLGVLVFKIQRWSQGLFGEMPP